MHRRPNVFEEVQEKRKQAERVQEQGAKSTEGINQRSNKAQLQPKCLKWM